MKFHSEIEFIEAIRRQVHTRVDGLVEGIGDDAAVFASSSGYSWCVSTDLLTSGVHFDSRFDSPKSIGHKSLAAGLSDLAAMGATPRYALVSIAVPANQASSFLPDFYGGFLSLARKSRVALIGGDTSRSARQIFIDVIVLGCIKRGREIRRSGARIGDRLFVSGTLGQAAWGLSLLKSGRLPRSSAERQAIRRHQFPLPHSRLGQWLSENKVASAMIDISDGLSTDLGHLCDESRVGAEIFENCIPLPGNVHSAQMLRYALSGGEDYELLFTVPANRMARLEHCPDRSLLHEIGKIVRADQKITLITRHGKRRSIQRSGWDHFR